MCIHLFALGEPPPERSTTAKIDDNHEHTNNAGSAVQDFYDDVYFDSDSDEASPTGSELILNVPGYKIHVYILCSTCLFEYHEKL